MSAFFLEGLIKMLVLYELVLSVKPPYRASNVRNIDICD